MLVWRIRSLVYVQLLLLLFDMAAALKLGHESFDEGVAVNDSSVSGEIPVILEREAELARRKAIREKAAQGIEVHMREIAANDKVQAILDALEKA